MNNALRIMIKCISFFTVAFLFAGILASDVLWPVIHDQLVLNIQRAEDKKQEKRKIRQGFEEDKKAANEKLFQVATSHQSGPKDPKRNEEYKRWLKGIADFANCSQERVVSDCQKFLSPQAQTVVRPQSEKHKQEEQISSKQDSSSVKNDFEKSLPARQGYLSRVIGPSVTLVTCHNGTMKVPEIWGAREKAIDTVQKGVSREYNGYPLTREEYLAIVDLSNSLVRFNELQERDGERVERIFNCPKVSKKAFKGTLDFVKKVDKKVQRRAKDLSEKQRFLLENLVMFKETKKDPELSDRQQECNPQFERFQKTKNMEDVCDDCLEYVRKLALGRFAAYKTRKEWHPDFKKQIQTAAQSSG